MFSLLALSLSFLFFICVVKVARDNLRGPWRNAPPGPIFLPLVGSILSFASSSAEAIKCPLLVIHKLVQAHGEVMRITMGSQHMIFLSGLRAIKEFSVMEETTARPYNATLLEMYSGGKPLGFGIGLGGERWKEQRRFAARVLRDLGAGKRGMDWKILQEVIHTIEDLNRRLANRSSAVLRCVDTYFDLPDLNIIWELVAAKRYDYDDPAVERQFEYLRTFLQESTAGPLTTTPWLKKVQPFKGIYENIRETMKAFRIMISEVIDEQRSSFNPGNMRGYIDRFLEAQQENRGNFFTDEDLVINCQDLFIAGSETTSKTLSNCFLQMILHPDVQKKVHEEIDAVVGRDRHVTMDDKVNLPYTEATLMEVRRLSTPFPITPPRTSTRDTTIDGYTIPAGIPVQMNIYSVLRGEKYFKDAHLFKPERFLNEKNLVEVPDAFIPFGYGKRRCLGENLAVVSNFVFFANLLQAFSFRCVDPSRPPSTLPCGGLTYGPQPFDAIISRRP